MTKQFNKSYIKPAYINVCQAIFMPKSFTFLLNLVTKSENNSISVVSSVFESENRNSISHSILGSRNSISHSILYNSSYSYYNYNNSISNIIINKYFKGNFSSFSLKAISKSKGEKHE